MRGWGHLKGVLSPCNEPSWSKLDNSKDKTWKKASLATQGLVTGPGDRIYIYEKANDPLGEGCSRRSSGRGVELPGQESSP